jgi:hypothetical protein
MGNGSQPTVPPSGGNDVGLTFIEMMFAVAAGDTASQVAKVIQQITNSKGPIADALRVASPSIFHLVLVLLLIATSWVGWAHSSVTREYIAELKPIFAATFPWWITFAFWMLLIDVFLVVCYFVLSEAAEIPKSDAATGGIVVEASARPEVFWCAVIMGTYLLWNICVAIRGMCIKGQRFFDNQRFWRMLSAIISLIIVGIAYWFRVDATSAASVVCVDVALICSVFVFRLRLVDSNSQAMVWDWVRGAILVAVAIILVRCA